MPLFSLSQINLEAGFNTTSSNIDYSSYLLDGGSEGNFYFGVSYNFGLTEKFFLQPSILYSEEHLLMLGMVGYELSEKLNLMAGLGNANLPKSSLVYDKNMMGYSFGLSYKLNSNLNLLLRTYSDISNRANKENWEEYAGLPTGYTPTWDDKIVASFSSIKLGLSYTF
jgi:hypothetical protein